MLNLPATTTQDDVIFLRGGLDLLTPSLNLKPGVCRDALNFECSITGGYTRIKGYERFDGQARPSDATYTCIDVDITGLISVGDTIIGNTSTASGKVIYISGSLVVYSRSNGVPFVLGEDVKVGGTTEGTVTATDGDTSAEDASFMVRMKALAAETYRVWITAVPGSGPVRGVLYLNGNVYAFRDNAGATALGVYKASISGWTAVAMPLSIGFTTGTSEYVDGETLSKGGASATIVRVVLESGSWGAGDAAGRFIVASVTGGPFSAGVAGGGGVATLTGAEAAVTMLPGGAIEFDIGAVGASRRAYGIDGVNRGFEFDGTTLIPINTGNTVDIPKRVMVHQHHLFFAFGNSVQNSGIGTPYTWTAIAGAGERLADGNVTQMRRLPGDQTTGAAAICADSGTQILYGTSEADFQLVTFEDSAGAKARSGQLMGQFLSLDDRGVMAATTAQSFGNFSAASMTLPIRTFIQTRRNGVTGSTINREKSQYRLFFDDGSALYITLANGKLVGSMPMQFPNIVRCCCAGESPDGAEVSYFGDEDGFVYQLDAGTSFDGASIEAYFRLVSAHQGTPRKYKRYRRASVEVAGESYCELKVGAVFGYLAVEREQWVSDPDIPVLLSPGYWDSMTWDDFIWDGQSLSPVYSDLPGSGECIDLSARSESSMFDSFTVNSIIVAYSTRREMR